MKQLGANDLSAASALGVQVRNASRPQRIEAIDATRGFAMLAVCVSHLGTAVTGIHPQLSHLLHTLGLIATPTFLLLSGLSAGYVLPPTASFQARTRFVDRGVFLLIVGHALIAIAHSTENGLASSLSAVYITDAIALSIICLALFPNSTPKRLLASGIILIALSWPLALLWQPSEPWLAHLNRILFYGAAHPSFPLGYTIPLATYLGIFLVGASMGRAGRHILSGYGRDSSVRTIGRIALALIAVLLVIKAASLTTVSWIDPDAYSILWAAVDPRQKRPAGFGYLAVHGAAAVLTLTILLRLGVQDQLRIGSRALATVGQASLMSYLFQEFAIFALPDLLGFGGFANVAFWLVYCAATIVLMWIAAATWLRIGGNQYYTIGLSRLSRSFRQRSELDGPSSSPSVTSSAPIPRPR